MSALPLPSEGGGVESALPQPSPVVTRLLSCLGLPAKTSTPTDRGPTGVRTARITPATHLTARPLPGRPLPAHGHHDTSHILRTSPGRTKSDRYPTGTLRSPMGKARSPMTASGSHMPMPARIGTGPVPATAHGHGISHDALRTARDRESATTGLGVATIVNTRPNSHTPVPAATAGPALR